MKILIADDEISMRLILRRNLEKWGYEVEEAVDGSEAWEKLTVAEPPGIAILDWMMPGMDGVEICKRLMGRREDAFVYTILLTSKTQKEDLVYALENGAHDFHSKPVDPDELRVRISVGRRLVEAEAMLRAQNEEMSRSLEMARRVQRGLIPPEDLRLPGLDVAFTYEPAAQVGGDLLDIIPLDSGGVVLFVGDAMGHGPQAALVMCVAKTSLRAAVQADPRPAAVLSRMNGDIEAMFKESFVTGACCLIDPDRRAAEYALAGQKAPFCRLKASPNILQEDIPGSPLGVISGYPYEPLRIGLAAGDLLVFCTDGILEAMNSRNEQYGADRLKDIIRQNASLASRRLLDTVTRDLYSHCPPDRMEDDLTLLAVGVAELG